MANLWDNLSDDQRNELVSAHLAGSRKDNANLSRAKDQLANNPNLVARLAEETGISDEADPELDDTAPDGEDESMNGQSEIDKTVNESIDDADMQETGSVTRQTDIPPPQEGEDMQTYIERLMASQEEEELMPTKKKRPQMPGRRPVDDTESYEDLA